MRERMLTHQPDVLRPRPSMGRTFRLGTLVTATAALLTGCGTPGVRGVAGIAPAPDVLWAPPRQPGPPPAPPPPPVAPELGARVSPATDSAVVRTSPSYHTASTGPSA